MTILRRPASLAVLLTGLAWHSPATAQPAPDNPAALPTPAAPAPPAIAPEVRAAEEQRRRLLSQTDLVEAEAALRKAEVEREKQTAELRRLQSAATPPPAAALPPLPALPAVKQAAGGAGTAREAAPPFTVVAIYAARHEALLRFGDGERFAREGDHLPDGSVIREIRLDRLVTERHGQTSSLFLD